MARFQKNAEELAAKRAREEEKRRIMKEVVATVPPELQWYEYLRRIRAL